ncbi:MAG: tryptophan-rich sensory protein [Bacilli bacterium]|nr:tryptophan-rich sensory protein [Bacilli bacterium]
MKKYLKVLIPLIICIVVGSLFVYLGKVSYDNIVTPKFAPPSFIFPIVWTIIYLIFYFTMIKYYDNSRIYNLYIIILIIQTLWNMVFFGLGSFLLALLIIIILYIVSWLFVYYLSKENKKYLYIYLIYIIWLLIATYLNIGIYILN